MQDYKEMYLKMFRASEKAVNILIVAQQECEEHYISSPDQEVKVIQLPSETKNDMDDK